MRASECDILVLPGLGGGSIEHWYTRWAKKLSTAKRVEQHDFEHPVLAEWTQRIEAAAASATRPIVLVAHSLGTIAAVHAAPRMDNVIGAMLVAPPSPDVLLTLTQVDPAFAHVKPTHLAFPALVVASRNDTYSTYEQATEFASALGATLVDAGDSGHINLESGHGPWPEGLMRLAGFLGQL